MAGLHGVRFNCIYAYKHKSVRVCVFIVSECYLMFTMRAGECSHLCVVGSLTRLFVDSAFASYQLDIIMVSSNIVQPK